MKKNIKTVFVLALVIMTIFISACGTPVGIIKEETDPSGRMTAHLFSRKTDGKTEYCLSLLEKDEVLDMAAEPNIHKSNLEFNFEWSDNMLGVMQHEDEEPIAEIKEFGDIMVIYGKTVSVEGVSNEE